VRDHHAGEHGERLQAESNALGILLALGAVLPLLVRRRYPLQAFF
jgi:hypothetical protein